MNNSDRTDREGRILGPANKSEYISWRKARDKRISNPSRIQTVNDRQKKAKESQT